MPDTYKIANTRAPVFQVGMQDSIPAG